MKIFELQNPSDVMGMILENKDFHYDPTQIALKAGGLVSAVFIPEQYKDTYMHTNLYSKLLPCLMTNGVLFAKIFFYSPDFNLGWE